MSNSAVADVVGCSVAHAPVIAALQAACFPKAWSTEAVSTCLRPPAGFGFLACLPSPPSLPVGFALCRALGDDSEILSLGVAPPHRQAGTGSLLLRAVVAGARERGARLLSLEVAETNQAARALYGRKGFKRAGLKPGYFDLPAGQIDALVLVLELNGRGR